MSFLFFAPAWRHEIERKTRDFLNAQKAFLTNATAQSTRAVGDAVQNLVAKEFESILGDFCLDYSVAFSRRAMADLAFRGKDNRCYLVDVKTHRVDASFSMPQLTSVERLARLYEDDKNVFALLIVSYQIEGVNVKVEKVLFVPIEFLGWECLTIGNLGWGQIQIANSHNVNLLTNSTRKKWMIEFFDKMLAFYPREIGKTQKRIQHFEEIRQKWIRKPDY